MISAAPIGLQTLQGRRVILERSAPKHAPFLQQCYQNDEFMDLYRLAQDRRQTEEQIKERLAKEQNLLPQQLKRVEWVIHRREKEPIGLAALVDYQHAHRRAEFLFGIVNPEYRATGISLEASLLILDFAFNQVQLHKLVAYIYGYNHYAQENVIRFGFTQEGRLREHVYFPKQGFLDLYLNALIESDFRANRRLSRFSKRLLGWDMTSKPAHPQRLPKERLAEAKQAFEKMALDGLPGMRN